MKTIKFNDKHYKLNKFKYRGGRAGLILENVDNEKDWFSATLNIENVPINKNEIIVKSHDFNLGILECLTDNKIISKQAKSIVLGMNNVYICKFI